MDAIIKTAGSHAAIANPLGCPACRRTVNILPGGGELLLCDARGRIWCVSCASEVLARISRLTDDRPDPGVYTWHFDDEPRPRPARPLEKVGGE